MEQRLIELEVRVTYQERIIGELDEVVRGFCERVEALERENVQLRETLVNRAEPDRGPNEPPPHY